METLGIVSWNMWHLPLDSCC